MWGFATLTSPVGLWDVSAVTSMALLFYKCMNFNAVPVPVPVPVHVHVSVSCLCFVLCVLCVLCAVCAVCVVCCACRVCAAGPGPGFDSKSEQLTSTTIQTQPPRLAQLNLGIGEPMTIIICDCYSVFCEISHTCELGIIYYDKR